MRGQQPSLSRAPKLVKVVRVSTDGQAQDRRAGVDRQLATVAKVVDSVEGALVADTVIIIGVGGSDLHECDEWRERVLPAIQDPHTHIAVDAIDRLLRPDDFNLTIAEQIKASGTKLYIPGAVVDPNETSGFIQLI